MATPDGFLPSPSNLLRELADDLVNGFFRRFNEWMTAGAVWLLRQAWHLMSATTEPVLTGSAFTAEYRVMILIGLAAVTPLLGLAVIQAIARQDIGGLLRTALLRLPLALLLTGVVIELVSLGLQFTDQASVSLLAAGGDPAARAFGHIETALAPISPAIAGFGGVLVVAVVGLVAFLLWVELAVRSAAVAVAALFLPLALSGLVWPATSHWARRLGETLAGLVLMKLVMAAVLALAGGALAATAGGISSVVEGLALLGLTAFAPFTLLRLIPVIESGAVAHLEGARPAQGLKDRVTGLAAAGGQQIAGLATALASSRELDSAARAASSAGGVYKGVPSEGGGSGATDETGAGPTSSGSDPGSGSAPGPSGSSASTVSSTPSAPSADTRPAGKAPPSSPAPPPPPPPPATKGEEGWLRKLNGPTSGAT